MKISKKAYINNFCTISCAGTTTIELFDSICQKKDTISIDKSYVKDREVAIGKIKSDISFNDNLKKCCEDVLLNSTLTDFKDTLLIVGSSVGGMTQTEDVFFEDKNYKRINPKNHPIDAIAYYLKQNFSFLDDVSFSTACTSSANALGYAKEVISKNIYKNVLVVGVDSLSYTTVCGFSALSVLSSKPCTPFDKNREGMNVSEAIAVLLIQDEVNNSSIELCGVGYSSDAHHMTQPHPDGNGAMNAMKNALDNANITSKDISYINAHGTGTQANDSAELNAICTLFENTNVKVSSTKSITGHTLGAAGAIEGIISCEVLRNQIIPPNKSLNELDRNEISFPLEVLSENISYVLSNSFAFGGNNTSLVFGVVK